MYVPSNAELIEQITVPVNDLLIEAIFILRYQTYERRNMLKLVDSFDKTNKLSYKSLKSCVNYIHNSIRYYRNQKAIELLKLTIITIDRYLEYNYYFLK